MPKKSKAKQIPAKAGAKATTKSGDKVEVVLKATKVVKDRRRGKYKPRKKTNKKQDKQKVQDDAIAMLRERIELEKLQALQRQSVREQTQSSQRIPNRRTGGDINNFFNKSRNDGTKEVVSDLAREVKSLREEIKKKDKPKPVEKPVEEPKEKSAFVEELETTQNEIQRQRIQRGIARRDEEQRRLANQKRIEKFTQDEKSERLRRERGREARRKERSKIEQRRQATEEQFRKEEQEQRTKTLRAERRKQTAVEKRLTEREQLEDLRKTIAKEDARRLKEQTERFSSDRIPQPSRAIKRTSQSQSEELKKAIEKEEARRLKERQKKEITPVRIASEPSPQKKKSNLQKVQETQREIDELGSKLKASLERDERVVSRPLPTPEPEPTPITRTKRTPTATTKTISQVSRNIIDSLNNEPLLNRERRRQVAEADEVERPSRRVKLSLPQEEDTDEEFQDVQEEEENVGKSVARDLISGGLDRVERREKELDRVSSDITEQVLEDAQEELTAESRKERRRSFKKDAEEEEQLKKKTAEEVQKLRELQEAGDKAYQDRLKAQIQIQDDERIAKDLLLSEARKRDQKLVENSKIDSLIDDIKEKKKKEKKKARDNLRKREQEEFLDEVAGEVIGGAVEQNLSERADKKASSKLVSDVFSNVVGGKALANEIITATQKIPRNPNKVAEIQEKIENLTFSDRSKKIERFAYTPEDAERVYQLREYNKNLKNKLATLFPKYLSQSDFKNKQSKKQSMKKIEQVIESARRDAVLTGKEINQLRSLLEELADTTDEVVKIENRYVPKTTAGRKGIEPSRKETKEERQERIRIERREREAGRGITYRGGGVAEKDDDSDDIDLEEI